jgi:hypothetical protein
MLIQFGRLYRLRLYYIGQVVCPRETRYEVHLAIIDFRLYPPYHCCWCDTSIDPERVRPPNHLSAGPFAAVL